MNQESKRSPSRAGEGAIARLGAALADWSEKWFPDAYVFAAIAVVIVCVAALSMGRSPSEISADFGKSFWNLIPFTMQMAFIVIGGDTSPSLPGAQSHRRPCPVSKDAENRRGLCRTVGHGCLAAELGLQHDLCGNPHARNQQACRRYRLSRNRSRRLPRTGRYLGPGLVIIGRALDGDPGQYRRHC